ATTGATAFDGGVLEVSSPNINGGSWAEFSFPAVGGSFVTGGYNKTISLSFGNPLANRPCWSGNSVGYVTTTVNLGSTVIGQTIQIRFRMGTDNQAVSGGGWRIDTITSTSRSCVDGLAPTVTAPGAGTVTQTLCQ
ncbi:MAG TPA: hypothetical protein VGR00_14025, partial [Thermoanaerobaculia bacterium]|nr:hypothetical protein [Thermoanaerobaculia bacterium]